MISVWSDEKKRFNSVVAVNYPTGVSGICI